MKKLSLLAVFAHPDDESYGPGGTLAKLATEGIRVSLVCATRGEKGVTGNPPLCAQEQLGAVREQELRCACDVLGIKDLRFLGYVDGTLEDIDPSQGEGKIVEVIREVKPDIVLTFPADGISGHPDHMAVHRWATAAFYDAGSPQKYTPDASKGFASHKPAKLYYVGLPASILHTFRPDLSGHDDMITTVTDVIDFVDTKLRAIHCHRTQTDFPDIPPEERHRLLGKEYFCLIDPPPPPDLKEDDLFCGLR